MIDMIMEFLPAALITFGVMFLLMPVALFLVRVIGRLHDRLRADLPRLRALRQGGWHDRRAWLAHPALPAGIVGVPGQLAGQRHVLDMRLDQEYLRSQPVNSEEGAPWGSACGYEIYPRSRRVSLQEHRPARLAPGKRQQRHRALPEQHAPRRHARNASHDEPGRPRRGVGQVARLGLPAGVRAYPEGALQGRRHDPARSKKRS